MRKDSPQPGGCNTLAFVMTGIFTLDATMAIMISGLVLGSAFYLIAAPKAKSNEYLFQTAQDLLAVAEEKGLLGGMVDGDTGASWKLKSAVPVQLCFELELRNSSGGQVFSDSNSCVRSGDFAISRRTFVSHERFYSAEMRVWLR